MIQFIRGNTEANDGYVGPVGSLSVDTQEGNIRLHDGVTPGGWVIANVDSTGAIKTISANSPLTVSGTLENPVIEIQAASPTTDGYMSAADKSKLDGIESGAEVNTVDSVNGQTGSVIIPNADSTTAGLISTGEQTFSGNKTFSGIVTIDEGESNGE